MSTTQKVCVAVIAMASLMAVVVTIMDQSTQAYR